MKSTEVYQQLQQVATVKDLTSVFESIASIRIARIKDRVQASQEFFSELWQIYTQLRVEQADNVSSWVEQPQGSKPNCYLVLTSEGGLSGDIDGRIINQVLRQYDPATTDLIVIGAHGELLLAQQGIKPARHFRLPQADELVDVRPVTAELLQYRHPTAFYQKYRSLTVQEVGRIDLLAHVQTLVRSGNQPRHRSDAITPADYIFEPGVKEVVQYLETVMLGIATNQLILESRLAQYASRFSAMYAARQTATDLTTKIERRYRSMRRAENDERAKEIVNAMKVHQSVG